VIIHLGTPPPPVPKPTLPVNLGTSGCRYAGKTQINAWKVDFVFWTSSLCVIVRFSKQWSISLRASEPLEESVTTARRSHKSIKYGTAPAGEYPADYTGCNNRDCGTRRTLTLGGLLLRRPI
jgi:hypothetical protein